MRRRKRQQQGQLFKTGGRWYVRFYDSRVIEGEVKRLRIAKRVVPAQGVTKAKARELAKPLLAPVNEPLQSPETIRTLAGFVEGVYFPA